MLSDCSETVCYLLIIIISIIIIIIIIINILISDNKYHIGKRNFKYFVGYANHSNNDIKYLLLKLSKSNGSTKSFGKVNYMSYMVEEKHKNILNKYSQILDNIK